MCNSDVTIDVGRLPVHDPVALLGVAADPCSAHPGGLEGLAAAPTPVRKGHRLRGRRRLRRADDGRGRDRGNDRQAEGHHRIHLDLRHGLLIHERAGMYLHCKCDW